MKYISFLSIYIGHDFLAFFLYLNPMFVDAQKIL